MDAFYDLARRLVALRSGYAGRDGAKALPATKSVAQQDSLR
jgi:hypothetical protein